MPAAIIKSLAEKSGKGIQFVEEKWVEAKKIVEEKYSDVEKKILTDISS